MLALEEAPDARRPRRVMPKLDGYEVTRRIRADERTCRMPIILLTARAQERDVALGYEAGADDYMKKPFSPQELRAHVQAILARGSTAGPPAGPR